MRLCLVDGCGKKHFARSLCAAHYHQKRCAEEPGYLERRNVLRRQRRASPDYRQQELTRDAKRMRDRYANDPEFAERCRERERHKYATDPTFVAKCLSYAKKRREDPGFAVKHLNYSRSRRTGFTAELIVQCREHQHGLCAICTVQLDEKCGSRHVRKEQADHCHETKKPRGLLCVSCNTCLGFYEKYQRRAGLRIEPYELYLTNPPVAQLGRRTAR